MEVYRMDTRLRKLDATEPLFKESDQYEESSIFHEEDTSTEDGTEQEDIGISKPFDPTLINISIKSVSLDILIKRIKEKEIELSPGFQRSEVWDIKAKSQLIESLLIRIPLPAFYMDATDDNKWLVVDGLQRLSTLRDFVIKNTLILKDLEFLSDYEGYRFKELPRSYQRRIEETQVTVYLIDAGTPPEVKFNIFKRINTGGLPLSSQEIRHALNQGPVTDLLKELADSVEFKKATSGSISDKRMAARECVLRYFAFILNDPLKYDSNDFDDFLSKTMMKLNRVSVNERTHLKDRLLRVLRYSFDIFGDTAFRRPKIRMKSPINKALFEVWTYAIDKESDYRLEEMKKNKEIVTKNITESLRNDNELIDAISQGTGAVSKVKLRFDRFTKIFKEALT